MYRQLLIIALTVICCIGSSLQRVKAQDYTRNYTSGTFTTGNGLADMTVWSLFQDKHGYLWAGTKGGVSRFDGLNFRNYYTSDGLRDNDGHDIIQLNDDTISILTRFAISFLSHDKITTINLPDSVSSQYFSYQALQNKKLYLFNIMPDTRNEASFLRHYLLDLETRKISVFPALENEDIIKVFTTRQGALNLFTKKGEWLQLEKEQLKQVGRIGSDLIDICKVNDSLYYYYDLQLQAFNKLTLHQQTFDTSRYAAYAHYSFSFKHNLVCTSSGTLYYNNNNDTVFRISNGRLEPCIVSDEAYYDLMVDNQDGLWLGSSHGLRAWHKFFFREHRFKKERNGMVLNSFHDNANRTWFSGHNNGIWYLENDKVTTLNAHQVKGMSQQTAQAFPVQFRGGVKMQDGRIFFPFYDGVIEVNNNKYTAHQLPASSIYHMVEGEEGRTLYIGTKNGLYKLTPDSGYSNLSYSNTINNAIIFYLFKDKKQRIWAVSQKGAGIIKQDTIRPLKELDSLSIFSMDNDYQGRYWIGTRNGLYCYREGQQPFRIGRSVFKGEVKLVLVYDDKTLVVADNQHIGFLNLAQSDSSEAWITFNSHTGYSGEDILNRSLYKDMAGDIWLFSETKVITCNPGNIIKRRPLPLVSIHSFSSSSDNVQWQSLSPKTDKLIVQAGNFNIKIEFLSVYLADPNGITYQYRLKGLNNEWSAPAANNNVSYAHLSPGNYTFEVRSSTDGIRWSETPAQVNFYIPSFWWQTWWFITSLAIGAGILLWLLSRYYISLKWKQRMRRLEKQLAIEQERHRISGEIHDDLGAGLSGIKLQAELAARKASTPEMKTELTRIYNVASELSARMREVIWSLNTENDTLEKLLYYMQQEGYKLFEHTDIQFRATYPPQLPNIPVSGQKRRDIYLIVKEALHNVMKHSGATEVSLTATLEGDIMIITVQDNGKGMTQPVDEEGNGIRNMHRRAAKTGGQLQIGNAGSGQGVAVHVRIEITSLAKH